MKERYFTTYYWGYKTVSQDDILKMSTVERVFVIDHLSEKDNFEFTPPKTYKSKESNINDEKNG